MDGSMISGTRIEKGEELFRFITNPLPPSKRKGSETNKDFHLSLHIAEQNSSRVSRSRKALGTIGPEDNEKEYCFLCQKPWMQCSCVVIVDGNCKQCGNRLYKCSCNTCDICHQKKTNGRCACCRICHEYPCNCDINTNSNSNTGSNGGNTENNNSSGNSSPSSGGSTNGNGNAQSPSHKVTADKISSATSYAVQQVIKNWGRQQKACNIGVQEAFKRLYGYLPKGLNCTANQMVRYWQDTPEKWQRISMEKAMEMANQGYFVVAGWVNPSGQIGHVVVMVPGEGEISYSWGNIKVPYVMDTGPGRRVGKQLISGSFSPKKKDKVVYFYYK